MFRSSVRLGALLITLLVALLALPTVASAAFEARSYGAHQLTIRDTSSEESSLTIGWDVALSKWIFTVGGGGSAPTRHQSAIDLGCQVDGMSIVCPALSVDQPYYTSISVYAGPGDDHIDSSALAVVPEEFFKSNGYTKLFLTLGGDDLSPAGTDGDDTIMGSTWDEIIWPGGGADQVWAGNGMDVIQVEDDGAADQFDGGGNTHANSQPERSQIYYVDQLSFSEAEVGTALAFTNAGIARSIDPLDQVDDVRGIIGTKGSDTLDASNITGNSGVYVVGMDGNDSLIGSKNRDSLDGETLDGGAGGDTLYGSEGDDDITGGPGADGVVAGGGNDTIRFADGEADLNVYCDAGTDTVYLDQMDLEPESCENIFGRTATGGQQPGKQPPVVETCAAGQSGTFPNCVTPVPPTCPAGQTGTPPNCIKPLVAVPLASQVKVIGAPLKLAKVAKAGVVSLSVPVKDTGVLVDIELRIAAKQAKALGLKVPKGAAYAVVGTGSVTAKKVGPALVKVALTKAAKGALAKAAGPKSKVKAVTFAAAVELAKPEFRTSAFSTGFSILR